MLPCSSFCARGGKFRTVQWTKRRAAGAARELLRLVLGRCSHHQCHTRRFNRTRHAIAHERATDFPRFRCGFLLAVKCRFNKDTAILTVACLRKCHTISFSPCPLFTRLIPRTNNVAENSVSHYLGALACGVEHYCQTQERRWCLSPCGCRRSCRVRLWR